MGPSNKEGNEIQKVRPNLLRENISRRILALGETNSRRRYKVEMYVKAAIKKVYYENNTIKHTRGVLQGKTSVRCVQTCGRRCVAISAISSPLRSPLQNTILKMVPERLWKASSRHWK